MNDGLNDRENIIEAVMQFLLEEDLTVFGLSLFFKTAINVFNQEHTNNRIHCI